MQGRYYVRPHYNNVNHFVSNELKKVIQIEVCNFVINVAHNEVYHLKTRVISST